MVGLYPALTKRFSLRAVACLRLDTIRPCLFLTKLRRFNPPDVLYTVPCHTCAREPSKSSNFSDGIATIPVALC